jgi:hypothetical protein
MFGADELPSTGPYTVVRQLQMFECLGRASYQHLVHGVFYGQKKLRYLYCFSERVALVKLLKG